MEYCGIKLPNGVVILGFPFTKVTALCVWLQTHREPEREYQILRDKAANQKRDVERALTRFIAKTGETESLFSDDPYAFPREF